MRIYLINSLQLQLDDALQLQCWATAANIRLLLFTNCPTNYRGLWYGTSADVWLIAVLGCYSDRFRTITLSCVFSKVIATQFDSRLVH